ncbi:MAG: NAD(P)-dependent oxidoreductase [SAR202 cluster bacterium]|jgi:nucleoside-diphosphate-sugar epimerase|nr:NAD(P)-dependent oxidoreductase [SAR202 cluster bacterium]MDP6300235.1 NAD(P)-dependent oxidoreductase [SAR202 cluster bacterium]MDP7103315.1 NAD(P)-dependent oxidoreductase [SAR202 cluster bacterium]MDP7224769.1 NAD(P)-dependent oxidoreductase [SAR202 cluster bacterium]MDP7412759.1 NAD(P)-dependent oxidoreductase [SAR202 cluster bacterium]|tara:strand:- start:3745 stop:4719 length:975 start_codon:yes stop_codon:yes gene_type:complete
MATIVTGGTGFVASNIVRELASSGHEVVSIDIKDPDDMVRRYLEPGASNVTWVTADILDADALARAVDGRDVTKIVHAAVYTAIRDDIEHDDSRRIVDINVAGTANMLDLARKIGVQRLLYVSSNSVYEGNDFANLLREDMAVQPRRLYGISKYASELFARRYGELHGFETVSVRLASPYGPMERVTGHRVVMSMTHHWTGQAVRGETIDAVQGGPWDFTFVLDTAAGIRTVLDAPELPHDVYNLAKGVPIMTNDMVAAIREAHPSVTVNESPDNSAPMLSSSTRGRVADTSRLTDDLGFTASHDMAAGLQAYIDWRQEYGYMV